MQPEQQAEELARALGDVVVERLGTAVDLDKREVLHVPAEEQCHAAQPVEQRHLGTQGCRVARLQARRMRLQQQARVGALVHWCIGALVHWCIGASKHWCIGALVHRCIGAGSGTAGAKTSTMAAILSM